MISYEVVKVLDDQRRLIKQKTRAAVFPDDPRCVQMCGAGMLTL